MSGSEKRFKIALSFPGEKREFVERVADCLAERIGRDRVLYDKYYEAEFAVLDLDTLLQDLYRNDSELIVIFLCAEYENKRWCQLEWRAVKNLITERTSDIMPLRFDNTEIPGIFPSDGYIWIGEREPEEIAKLILRRAGYKPEPSPTPKPTDAPNQTTRINTDKLPQGSAHLIGRNEELSTLDAAWNDPHAAIMELVAPGGTGKTALVKAWLMRMRAEQWRGAQRVYGWSFYSQGSDEKRQASEDGFLADALKWFEVEIEPSAAAADKGSKLAEAVMETRTLLILDGMEPLQYPPGATGGRLKAPGVDALLYRLASDGQAGLCLVTTRETLRDLEEHTRTDDCPCGGLLKYDLHNLNESDGARLLHTLGVTRAGAAEIEADDQELIDATREVKGHALTLNLLGRYLKLAHAGDIRHRKEVDFQEADAELDGCHAFRVMAAYQTWFEREGEQGARQLAALRLLGFFDRPADRDNLDALRAEPPIPGLTEPLVGLSEAQWSITLGQLAECGLILRGEDASLDTHPLVRENLAKRLRDELPEAWREGHRRLYEQLKNSAPYRPDDLAGLQPLYRAVAHGALAGLHQQACEEILIDRILRGANHAGYYSSKQLGAVGENLGAVAGLFDLLWERPAQSLTSSHQAWILGEAAFYLRALGRPGEAATPMGVQGKWLKRGKIG